MTHPVHTENLKALIAIFDAIGDHHRNTSINITTPALHNFPQMFWDIATALRGPDLDDAYHLKHSTTAILRTLVTHKTARYAGVDYVSATGVERLRIPAVYIRNGRFNHFLRHISSAFYHLGLRLPVHKCEDINIPIDMGASIAALREGRGIVVAATDAPAPSTDQQIHNAIVSGLRGVPVDSWTAASQQILKEFATAKRRRAKSAPAAKSAPKKPKRTPKASKTRSKKGARASKAPSGR